MNKRKVGAAYEQQAALYAKSKGMEVLACNYRCRLGEIDLIMKDQETLVFVEVKYRQDAGCGYPEEAVDLKKQIRICKVADYYRLSRGIGFYTPVRYDVAAVSRDRIRWYKNAFPHRGNGW